MWYCPPSVYLGIGSRTPLSSTGTKYSVPYVRWHCIWEPSFIRGKLPAGHQQLPRADCSLLQQPQETNAKCLRKTQPSFLWQYSLVDITSLSNKCSQVVLEGLSSLFDLGVTLVYFSQPVTIHPLNEHCPLSTPQCTKSRPMF